MPIPHVLTETSASIFLDFVPYTVPSSHANWTQILEALNNPETTEDDIRPLLDVAKSVSDYTNGAVEYRDRALFYNGKPLDTPLTRRIISHMSSGLEGIAAPLIEFLKNVMQNPSRRSVLGLYDWVEKAGLPITPDGYVMAYKIVEENFLDCYTKTFDNTPGQIVEVARNEVDEDPDRTCSYGLHVCSASYLPKYGPSNKQVVIVKVNPADFVAVPRDYNTAKARVCRYEVLQAVPKETAAQFFPNAYVYSPEPEPTAKPSKFEVGQVWRDEDGDLITITVADEDGVEGELEGGGIMVYDANGANDYCNLIELVKDVIDWDAPIETVNGTPAFNLGYDSEEEYYRISIDNGGWFYLADGTHKYGFMPDLRNVR